MIALSGKKLKHMRFLLLDKITRLQAGTSITGIKCWSLSNELFFDHFPGHPLVPGVLLTESMAQLSGILIEKTIEKEFPKLGKVYCLLSIIQKAKFKQAVKPGDQCRIQSSILSVDINRANVQAETWLGDTMVAECKLSFVIAAQDQLPDNRHLQRMEEYKEILFQHLDSHEEA